jgi:hypothetical protein
VAYGAAGTNPSTTTYRYDTAGNQTGNDGAGLGKPLTISYLPTNQTQAISNTSQEPVTMTWTGAGQSERIHRSWTDSGTAYHDSYTYTPLGLAGRTTNTPNTPAASYYIRDPYGTPIAERNSDGTEYYYLFDGQGNVVGLEDPGTMVDSYDYCPTGNDIGTTGTVPNAFHQAGGEYDPGTKQYHTGSGYYDPTQGVNNQASFALLGFSYTLPSAVGFGGAAADVAAGSLCALSGLCEALAAGVGIAVVGATGYEIYQHRDAIGQALGNVSQFAKASKTSGKARSTDIPSWARGQKALPGESSDAAARRLLNDKYGQGNWPKGPGSEYNQLKKHFDRG